MKIGVCSKLENAGIIKSLGYDFIEEGMSRIAALTDAEFSACVKEYERIDLPVYSFNVFFGSGVTLYGENSAAEVEAYAKHAFARAAGLGGSLCVIGSGRVRNIPEALSAEAAEQRFLGILSILAEAADRYGIQLALEPLNKLETNFINTVGDAARIAKASGLANVGSLVDFYHFFMENEKESELPTYADTLIHAHLARPNADRKIPQPEDLPAIERWAALLKGMNYQGAIALEPRFDKENLAQEIANAKRYMELFR